MARILEIIETECLPRRDCMLTVQDMTGEAGFLYFKDAELIEANCANRWGQDALARISEWQLAEHFVAPLPMGIKRSLWGSLDSLFSGEKSTQHPLEEEPAITEEDLAEVAASLDLNELAGQQIVAAIHEIQGLQQVGLLKAGKFQILHETSAEGSTTHPPQEELAQWLSDFIKRGNSLGEMIGFGRIQELAIGSNETQVVGLTQKTGLLLVARCHDAGLDDLESTCRNLLNPESRP